MLTKNPENPSCEYHFRLELTIADLAIEKLHSALNISNSEQLEQAINILELFCEKKNAMIKQKFPGQKLLDLKELKELITEGFDYYVTEAMIDASYQNGVAIEFFNLDLTKNNKRIKKELAIAKFKNIVNKTLTERYKKLKSMPTREKTHYLNNLNKNSKQVKTMELRAKEEEYQKKLTKVNQIVPEFEMFLVDEILEGLKTWLSQFEGEIDKDTLNEKVIGISTIAEIIELITKNRLNEFVLYISNEDIIDSITQYGNIIFLEFLINENQLVLECLQRLAEQHLSATALETIFNTVTKLHSKARIPSQYYTTLLEKITPARIALEYQNARNDKLAIQWFKIALNKSHDAETDIPEKILQCVISLMDKEIFAIGKHIFLNYFCYSPSILHSQVREKEEALYNMNSDDFGIFSHEAEHEDELEEGSFDAHEEERTSSSNFEYIAEQQESYDNEKNNKILWEYINTAKNLLAKLKVSPAKKFEYLLAVARRGLLLFDNIVNKNRPTKQMQSDYWRNSHQQKNQIIVLQEIIEPIEKFLATENKLKLSDHDYRSVYMLYKSFCHHFQFTKNSLERAIKVLSKINEEGLTDMDHDNIAHDLYKLAWLLNQNVNGQTAIPYLKKAITCKQKIITNFPNQLQRDDHLVMVANFQRELCTMYREDLQPNFVLNQKNLSPGMQYETAKRHCGQDELYSKITESTFDVLTTMDQIVNKENKDYCIMYDVAIKLLQLFAKSAISGIKDQAKIEKQLLKKLFSYQQKIIITDFKVRMSHAFRYSQLIVIAAQLKKPDMVNQLVISSDELFPNVVWSAHQLESIVRFYQDSTLFLCQVTCNAKQAYKQSFTLSAQRFSNLVKWALKIKPKSSRLKAFNLVERVLPIFYRSYCFYQQKSSEENTPNFFSEFRHANVSTTFGEFNCFNQPRRPDRLVCPTNPHQLAFMATEYNLAYMLEYFNHDNWYQKPKLQKKILAMLKSLYDLEMPSQHSLNDAIKQIQKLINSEEKYFSLSSMNKIKSQFKAIISNLLAAANFSGCCNFSYREKLQNHIDRTQRLLHNLPTLSCEHLNPDCINEKGQTPLMVAIIHKSTDVISYLLAANANVALIDENNKSVFHYLRDQLKKGDVKTAIPFIKSKYVKTVLHLVVTLPKKRSLTELAKAIITEEQIAINKKLGNKNSLLHLATQSQNCELVSFLLRRGAKQVKNGKKQTPYKIALTTNNEELIKLLDPNCQKIYKLITMFHAKKLIEIPNLAGFNHFFTKTTNLNEKHSAQMETCLHIAARYGYTNLVEWLLKREANPLIKNAENKTALEVATNREIQGLLKTAVQELTEVPTQANYRPSVT